MTLEELRRETGTGDDTIPYYNMADKLKQLGIGSVVTIGAILLALYGVLRWVTNQ